MKLEDLQKIVGPFYEYNADIRLGRINAKTLEARDIKKVDIKNIFSNNIYNLNVR